MMKIDMMKILPFQLREANQARVDSRYMPRRDNTNRSLNEHSSPEISPMTFGICNVFHVTYSTFVTKTGTALYILWLSTINM